MKKILALILAVCCVLSLASCKKEEEAPVVNAADIAPFQSKIDASAPETATVTVTFKSALGTLDSEYLVTYSQVDGSATVEYTYEQFNTTDSSEFKSTYEGQLTVNADGTLSKNPAGVASVEALTFDINLDPAKIYSATVTSGILSIVVKAENTAAVLGVNLGVDANVIITVGSLGVGSVAISYSTTEGSVDIVSTYTYYVEPEEEETEN